VSSGPLCSACLAAPDRACRSCARRRVLAHQRFRAGESPAQIAEALRLSPLQVCALIEAEADREEERALRAGAIPTSELRTLFERWQRADPDGHTPWELAARYGASPSAVRRMIGLKALPPSNRAGTGEPIKETVTPASATRLALAMGYDPPDIPWM
jgi:hypothetical protein